MPIQFKRGSGDPPTLAAGEPAFDTTGKKLWVGDGSVNTLIGPTGGGGGATISFMETPTGAIDGVNTTYTLANTPDPSVALMLFLNGLLQSEGGSNDFTISGDTITMNAAPVAGDTITATYPY